MTSLQPNPFDGTHMRARMFARRSRSRSCRTKSHRASICISQHGMSESVLGAEKYTHMCVRVLQVQLWTDCSLTVPKTPGPGISTDRKSTRLNSSHMSISYAVFCLKKKKK